LIISLYAEPVSDDSLFKQCNALTDYKWVSLEEARNYDLIEGIYEGLKILDRKLKIGRKSQWTRDF